MPQPLRRRVALDFMVSKLADHPDLCAKFAQVVAVASLLETRLSGLLAMLSGGSAEVTLAMFMAVNSTDAQRAMLRSAAEVALKGQEFEALCDLLDDYKARAKERNKVAHGIWATSSDVPNALLLVRAADLAALNKRLAMLAMTNIRGPLPDDLTDHLWQNCMIYRAKDFEDVLARLIAYDTQIVDFWQNLMQARIDEATSAEQGALPLEGSAQDPLPQGD
jgi:hypothetical protein